MLSIPSKSGKFLNLLLFLTSKILFISKGKTLYAETFTLGFWFKTLDNTAESAVTIPATNQISLNCVVDSTAFFGTGTGGDDDAKENGLFGVSKNKTKVFFNVYLDGTDSASKFIAGSGFVAGLAPTVNMDSPVWVTPVTIEVDGDLTEHSVP